MPTGGADLESDVPVRVFEALYERGELSLDAKVREELAAIGWVPSNPKREYSARTWRASIEVVRRHLFADLTEAEGNRKLGRHFAAGLGKTTVGRVLRTVAPLFGVERTLLSIPRYLHTVRQQMRVEMVVLGTNRHRLLAWDPNPNAEFIAGCMLGIFDIFSIEGQVTVISSDAERFELELSWP